MDWMDAMVKLKEILGDYGVDTKFRVRGNSIFIRAIKYDRALEKEINMDMWEKSKVSRIGMVYELGMEILKSFGLIHSSVQFTPH